MARIHKFLAIVLMFAAINPAESLGRHKKAFGHHRFPTVHAERPTNGVRYMFNNQNQEYMDQQDKIQAILRYAAQSEENRNEIVRILQQFVAEELLKYAAINHAQRNEVISIIQELVPAETISECVGILNTAKRAKEIIGKNMELMTEGFEELKRKYEKKGQDEEEKKIKEEEERKKREEEERKRREEEWEREKEEARKRIEELERKRREKVERMRRREEERKRREEERKRREEEERRRKQENVGSIEKTELNRKEEPRWLGRINRKHLM